MVFMIALLKSFGSLEARGMSVISRDLPFHKGTR